MRSLTIRTMALAAVATGAVPMEAHAATVFTQGPVLNDGGVRSIFWNADDFTLASTTTVTGATFDLVQDIRQPAGYYNPTINYAVYSDLGGTVGALLQTGTATATRTALALSPYAGISYLQFYAWAFDFATPVTALANTRYWIGVQQSDDIALGILQGGANPGAAAEIAGSVNGPYGRRDVGLAFSVQGTAATVPGAVPEPAGWALMIVGIGAVGQAMRRRAKVRTRVRFV